MEEPTDGGHDAEVRGGVADACLILGHTGHEHFFLGHVSARSTAGNSFWVKPTGMGLAETTIDDLVLSDLDGQRLAGEHRLHQESPIHAEIYRARPDVNAVIHTHPMQVAAFAGAEAEFRMVSQDSVLFVDGVARYDDPRLVVTAEQGRAVAEALGEHTVVVMRNHGYTVAAGSLPAAIVLAASFERSLELQRLASEFGAVREISDAEAHEMAAYFATSYHGRIEAMYGWLLRRARAAARAAGDAG